MGWSSILRGVGSYKHRIDGNGIGSYEKAQAQYKTFLWYAKHIANLRTASIVTWNDLYTHLIEPDATDFIRSASDSEGTYYVEDLIKNQDFDIIFWGNDDVDGHGHGYGFDPNVPEYLRSIEIVDSQIKRLMDAIDLRETREDEEWLITITSDHGGRGTSHGPKDEDNRKISIFFIGDSIKSGTIPVDCEVDHSQMDIFPSVMEWMRIPVDPTWEIDGKSRLQYELTNRKKCDLSETKPSILTTGAYSFSAHDAENIIDQEQLAVDQCLSRTTNSGVFHYQLQSPCAN